MIFRDHGRIGRILFGACHKATGRNRFARTPDRGAAVTILSSVRPIRDSLLDYALAHGRPVMIAEAAPHGYGLVERTYGSPSSTGRSVVDETLQATGHDWYEPLSDLVHANAGVIRAVAYINAAWSEQPM